MKTIRLKLNVKQKLDAIADGQSLNKTIRMVLENAEEQSNVIQCDKPQYYNAKIDDDLLDKLNHCRKYSSETHSQIINRILDEYINK